MKNLIPNDPQSQRWILMGALMMALGTSMSLNPATINLVRGPQPSSWQQTHLASETARVTKVVTVERINPSDSTSKITNEYQVIEAIAGTDQLVVLPLVNGVIKVDASFQIKAKVQDIEAIQKAILENSGKKPEATAAEKDAKKEVIAASADDLVNQLQKSYGHCGASGKENMDAIECLSTGMIEFSKKHTDKNASQALNRFFGESVKPLIVAELEKISTEGSLDLSLINADWDEFVASMEDYDLNEDYKEKSGQITALRKLMTSLIQRLDARSGQQVRAEIVKLSAQRDRTLKTLGVRYSRQGNLMQKALMQRQLNMQRGLIDEPMSSSFISEWHRANNMAQQLQALGLNVAGSMNAQTVQSEHQFIRQAMTLAPGFEQLKRGEGSRYIKVADQYYLEPMNQLLQAMSGPDFRLTDPAVSIPDLSFNSALGRMQFPLDRSQGMFRQTTGNVRGEVLGTRRVNLPNRTAGPRQ